MEPLSKHEEFVGEKPGLRRCGSCLRRKRRTGYRRKTYYLTRKQREANVGRCQACHAKTEIPLPIDEKKLIRKLLQHNHRIVIPKIIEEEQKQNIHAGGIPNSELPPELQDYDLEPINIAPPNNEEAECEICHILRKDTYVLPCMHAMGCHFCTPFIGNCTICQTPIKEWRNFKCQ